MDEDFFLTDFSLEDIDFDFNIYEEINVSPVEASMDTQRGQFKSNFDHQMDLDFLKENPKPAVKEMMKIKNKPRVISFDFSSNVSSAPAAEDIIMDRCGSKRKASSPATRSPVLAKEHVIAERKRREKLSEKFIALSALLPGLKKVLSIIDKYCTYKLLSIDFENIFQADKITVLDDAISRVKQLQEQIRKLKEEKEARREMESMVLVKKSIVFFDEEPYLSSSSSSDQEKFDQPLPEIEAKVAQNKVLIRIHCEKSKWCMVNILNTIENLQLRIENSFVLPFGDSTLDITVLAQMEKDFSVSAVKDLVRNLRLTLV